MVRTSPQQYAARWSAGMNAAGPNITAGVNAVTVAPGQAAAAQQALMLQNLTAAITSGKWAKNVAAVSLSSWQKSMTTKGVSNIAAGVSAAASNKIPQWTTMLNNVAQAVDGLSSTPRGNLQQNIARAVNFMTTMSTLSANSGS